MMRWLREETDIWLEHTVGDVPLLLTCSHAGRRLVNGISGLRADPALSDCGFNDCRNDLRTREVAEAILDHMDWRGLRPYMIVPQVSRRDVDLNRSWNHNQTGYATGGVSGAAQNVARIIYDGFYDQIQSFISDIRSRFAASDFDRTLLIDIHGVSLADDIDIEIGTRQGTSADVAIVYTSTGDSVTLWDTLSIQGFALRSTAATAREPFSGCEVLRVNGRSSGGLHAVQVELSSRLRGGEEDSDDAMRVFARHTGVRLALALENFLKANEYSVHRQLVAATKDDDIYAAIML
jgi:N-formylglutamate amidohydrolase